MSMHFPTWLDALRMLEELGNHTVARERLGARGAWIWRWAVRNRGPDGDTGPNPGPSPFLCFANGQSASDARQLLPLWIADRRLRLVTVEELAREVLRDPAQRLRYQLSRTIADYVCAHPAEWVWLRDLLVALDPDPFATRSDDRVEGDEPASRLPRQSLEDASEPGRRSPSPVNVVPAETRSSLRPTLRKWNERT